jgi:hypothetical protein
MELARRILALKAVIQSLPLHLARPVEDIVAAADLVAMKPTDDEFYDRWITRCIVAGLIDEHEGVKWLDILLSEQILTTEW